MQKFTKQLIDIFFYYHFRLAFCLFGAIFFTGIWRVYFEGFLIYQLLSGGLNYLTATLLLFKHKQATDAYVMLIQSLKKLMNKTDKVYYNIGLWGGIIWDFFVLWASLYFRLNYVPVLVTFYLISRFYYLMTLRFLD